jgi:plasmid stabilization system protein ParE
MARTLRYHPLFDCDVREAASWYDRRSPGLGDAFVEIVRRSVSDIVENPERFALSPAGCRYTRLRRFPYLVLFEVAEDELLLLAVLHTARSMEKWRERLGD